MISRSTRAFIRAAVLKTVVQSKWSTPVLRTLTATSIRNGKRDDINLSSLFKPVSVKSCPDDINIGAELTGTIDKTELVKLLNKFTQKKEIRTLCLENGLDCKLDNHETSTSSFIHLPPQCTCNNRPSPTSGATAWKQRTCPWTCTSSFPT